jgi:hypothetical protein
VARQPPPVVHELACTLEELYFGTVKVCVCVCVCVCVARLLSCPVRSAPLLTRGPPQHVKITKEILNQDGRTTRAQAKTLEITIKPGYKVRVLYLDTASRIPLPALPSLFLFFDGQSSLWAESLSLCSVTF